MGLTQAGSWIPGHGVTRQLPKALLFPVIVLIFIQPTLAASVSLQIDGYCRDYNVTLTGQGLEATCYDVKIDVTSSSGRAGEILDPREGWKSTFFYIDQDFCMQENQSLSRTYQIRTGMPEILNFEGILRSEEKFWSTDFIQIAQDCKGHDQLQLLLLTLVIVVLVMLIGIVVYVKGVTQEPKNYRRSRRTIKMKGNQMQGTG